MRTRDSRFWVSRLEAHKAALPATISRKRLPSARTSTIERNNALRNPTASHDRRRWPRLGAGALELVRISGEGSSHQKRADRAINSDGSLNDLLAYCNPAAFHSCRHPFITNLERAGAHPKVAQTLARHSDIRLTLNVYTHAELADQTKAIEELPGPPG